MAPSSGRYLAQADLLGTVEHMQRDLDGGIQPTVMKPTVPLTNGMLLDLYRLAKLAKSAGRRIVELLQSLGYEATTTCPKDREKMWCRHGGKLIQMSQKNLQKGKLAKHLAMVRNDCIQPDRMQSPVNRAAVSFDPAASVSLIAQSASRCFCRIDLLIFMPGTCRES